MKCIINPVFLSFISTSVAAPTYNTATRQPVWPNVPAAFLYHNQMWYVWSVLWSGSHVLKYQPSFLYLQRWLYCLYRWLQAACPRLFKSGPFQVLTHFFADHFAFGGMAISVNISFLRSPKPGAFTAATLMVPGVCSQPMLPVLHLRDLRRWSATGGLIVQLFRGYAGYLSSLISSWS